MPLKKLSVSLKMYENQIYNSISLDENSIYADKKKILLIAPPPHTHTTPHAIVGLQKLQGKLNDASTCLH